MNDDSVVLKYTPAKVEIVSAPDEIRVSLQALRDAPQDTLLIVGSDIIFAPFQEHGLTYEVVGFDRYAGCLELRKVS